MIIIAIKIVVIVIIFYLLITLTIASMVLTGKTGEAARGKGEVRFFTFQHFDGLDLECWPSF